jgi:hypothetical protein
MFKVEQNGMNRLDIQLSGKLDTDEMIIALDELVGKSENIENGKMLYEIIDFHLPSLGAIVIEFSRLPSMFGLMKKFDRAAVLTDKTWLKKVSEFEGALFPGSEQIVASLRNNPTANMFLTGYQMVSASIFIFPISHPYKLKGRI